MSLGSSRNLTPSDVANDNFSWILITTTAGTLVYTAVGGNVVTLVDAPVGVWLPVGNATNINTASTAAGFIVA